MPDSTTLQALVQASDVDHAAQPVLDDCFLLHGPAHQLIASGQQRLLYQGSMQALGGHGEAVLAAIAQDATAAPLLVGALPFERDAPCHLYQPQTLHTASALRAASAHAPVAHPPSEPAHLQAWPDRDAYQAMVRQATPQLDGRAPQSLRKVVLARSLVATRATAFELPRLLQRLMEDASVTTYCLPLAAPPGAAARSHLVGATPELLIARRAARIASHPLAGSLPRAADAAADAANGTRLMQSAKDRQEHRVVVEFIADLLTPLCSHLHVPTSPSLRPTASMWHLGTRIEGTLRRPEDLASSSSLALAARLQPTPALCGAPRDAALLLLRQLEPFERGFYGGAIGWSDNAGDGDWHVAIRCAEIDGRQARLFAGAGIMHDSDPLAEADETAAKFTAMLHALELDGHVPYTSL